MHYNIASVIVHKICNYLMEIIEKFKTNYYEALKDISDNTPLSEIEHAYNEMTVGTEWEGIGISEEKMRKVCMQGYMLAIADQLTKFATEIKKSL